MGFKFVNFYLWVFFSIASIASASLPMAIENPLFVGTELEEVPVAFKGRFRPAASASRLWLSDIYHAHRIKSAHRKDFLTLEGSALDLQWKMHFLGHTPWDNVPLFWVENKDLKEILHLDPVQDQFSYLQLYKSIYVNKESNLKLMRLLLPYYFFKKYNDPINRSQAEKMELTDLASGIWVIFHKKDLLVAAAPKIAPWNFLEPKTLLLKEARQTNSRTFELENKAIVDEALRLLNEMTQYAQLEGRFISNEIAFEEAFKELQEEGISSKEIAFILDSKYPLKGRLNQFGSTLKLLPSKMKRGEWISLKALKAKVYDPESQKLIPVENFTLYSDKEFQAIQSIYFDLEALLNASESPIQIEKIRSLARQLGSQLNRSYTALEQTPYKEASNKALFYPSKWQLKAEKWHYQYPISELAMTAYALAVIAFLFSFTLKNERLYHLGFVLVVLGFSAHTALMALRCYILQRPPVSNMFETVVYVPWIGMVIAFILFGILKNRVILAAAALSSLILLILLHVTDLNSGLENVQAVLDSQYWLIIHVLMVVGSYGAFMLCGVLGHIYLINYTYHVKETEAMRSIARLTVQAMYVGLALLIPGTILGGVWAAESWGRFWDWDPKESWAFVSICIYLIWLHAYTFHHVRNFGLAVGSVVGLQAISFTWYGVNYILGSGLHSYGFGSGGERFYYLFLLIEALFLIFVLNKWVSNERNLRSKKE